MNKREQQIQDGAYDGRYREKVVKDKKKEENKKKARKWKQKHTDT
jgi:hypothetical protein